MGTVARTRSGREKGDEYCRKPSPYRVMRLLNEVRLEMYRVLEELRSNERFVEELRRKIDGKPIGTILVSAVESLMRFSESKCRGDRACSLIVLDELIVSSIEIAIGDPDEVLSTASRVSDAVDLEGIEPELELDFREALSSLWILLFDLKNKSGDTSATAVLLAAMDKVLDERGYTLEEYLEARDLVTRIQDLNAPGPYM